MNEDQMLEATIEFENELALKRHEANKAKQPVLKATGFCLFCDEIILEEGRRFCDAECRDGFDMRTR